MYSYSGATGEPSYLSSTLSPAARWSLAQALRPQACLLGSFADESIERSGASSIIIVIITVTITISIVFLLLVMLLVLLLIFLVSIAATGLRYDE